MVSAEIPKQLEETKNKSVIFSDWLLQHNNLTRRTPTFLRRSPTMFSADIRADGVSGEFP